MPSKIKGKGSTLSIDGTSVAQIKSIPTALSGEVSIIDATTLDSVVREKVSGIGNWGTMDFEVCYDPDDASHALFHELVEAPATTTQIITLSNNKRITFDGIMSSFSITGLEVDGLVSASVTFEIDGTVSIDGTAS